MNIFAEFRTTILAALDKLVADGTLPEGLETRRKGL